MIDAYLAGIPDNGKPFPDGSKMAKIAVEAGKQSEEAPLCREYSGRPGMGIGFIGEG